MDTLTIGPLANGFTSPIGISMTQPRGWWDLPASGKCRGMERQHVLGVAPTIKRNAVKIGNHTADLMEYPSGRNLLLTDFGIRTTKAPSRRDKHREHVRNIRAMRLGPIIQSLRRSSPSTT